MFLEVVESVPVLSWIEDNFLILWLSIKLLVFISEVTRNKWDDKVAVVLEKFLRYITPNKAPFIEELDKKEDTDKEESRAKRIEKEVRKQIRNL